MANITDKITNVSSGTRPVSTTVSTLRTTGATSLSTNDLTGWATDTAVHFITYKIDGQGKVIVGSQTDWKGIVSGTSINNLTVTGGTDAGNAVGDIVEILPTARWAKDLTDAIRVHSAQDGNLLPITASNVVPTAAIQDSAVTTTKLAGTSVTAAKIDFTTIPAFGAWTAYTPTVTGISAGTKNGRYIVIGKTVTVEASIGITGAATGVIAVSLPFTSANPTPSVNAWGNAFSNNTGVDYRTGMCVVQANSTVVNFYGSGTTNQLWSNLDGRTWKNTDTIQFTVTYEIS